MLDFAVSVFFPAVIIIGGIYFSLKLGFFSIRHPIAFLRTLADKNGSFESLNLALAGTLGVGNIVGVVNALRLGGSGAIFWMCVCALFAANLKYAESYAASLTKRMRDGNFFGGAYIYIEKSFKIFGKTLAFVFCVCFIFSSVSTGSLMQSGAVVGGITSVFPSVHPIAVSLLLGFAVLFSVTGGLKKISGITNKLVPAMTFVYLILTLVIICVNIKSLPGVLLEIISSAFGKEGMIFGVGGFVFTEGMKAGIMRGLLSNEAGCGSSASAHATAKESTPHRQGCLGIAEVYADTVIMCTLTGLALLCGGADFSIENDISLTVKLYGSVGGSLFSLLSVICITVFGYASLICFAGYGIECSDYIFKSNRLKTSGRVGFTVIYILCILLSPLMKTENVLFIADFSMGVMALINISALFRMWRRRSPPPLITRSAGASPRGEAMH